MNAEGEITFSTEIASLDKIFCSKIPYKIKPGRYIKVSISDNGSGMDHETIDHIFEPFYTTKEQGNGAIDFIQKPYHVYELSKKITQALEKQHNS